jgi:hypothetical protein
LEIDLERLRSEIQAISAGESEFRSRSRRECCSNARVRTGFTLTCRTAPSVFLPGVGKKYEFAVFEVAGNAHIRERFQSTAGMRYDCVARQPNLPDVREEAM